MPDPLLYQAPRGESSVCCQTNDYYYDIFAVFPLLSEAVLLDWAPQGQSKNQRICPTSFEHTESYSNTGVLMFSEHSWDTKTVYKIYYNYKESVGMHNS